MSQKPFQNMTVVNIEVSRHHPHLTIVHLRSTEPKEQDMAGGRGMIHLRHESELLARIKAGATTVFHPNTQVYDFYHENDWRGSMYRDLSDDKWKVILA